MKQQIVPHLRLMGPSLASYLRPFGRDYKHTAHLIAQGFQVGKGLIFDPVRAKTSQAEELRRQAHEDGLELILDPLSLALAHPDASTWKGVRDLEWAADEPHSPNSFARQEQRNGYCGAIAEHAVRTDMTAVLAPTHHLVALDGPWLDIDSKLSAGLRRSLDNAGGATTRIYYPLCATLTALNNEDARRLVFSRLRRLARDGVIDAVWFRIQGFGATKSGPVNLRRYVDLARSAHEIGLPVVAERTGTVGLALLAFGAVGGIESGVTFGEGFDIGSFRKRQNSKPFMPAARVYLPEIGAFLKKPQAARFFRQAGMRNQHACQRECCRRGHNDMLDDPRRHFVISRAAEVAELSNVPADERADHYLDRWLRPASDRVIRAAKAQPSLESQRTRLEHWRVTLASVRERDQALAPSISAIPLGRRRTAS